MADKKLEYKVEVDASGAVSDLKKLGDAGEKAGKQIGDGFKDVGSKSEAAFDKVIANLKDVTTESQKTIQVVGKIGDKFGEGFDPQATAQLVNSLRKAGVEFDTIEARADELATTMRGLQDVRIDAGGGLDRFGDSAERASVRNDELTASAQKSRNATANLWGNAAQDLGQFTGIAGSAGVALGQLAEGAADAANDGEKLGSVLQGVAASAGPIAAVSAALFLVQNMMKNIADTKAFDKKQAEDFAAAIDDVGDSYAAVLQIAESGGLQGRVQEGGLLGEVFPRKETLDLVDQLDTLGLKIADVQDVIRSGARFQDFPDWLAGPSESAVRFRALLDELDASGLDTSDMLKILREVTGAYTDSNVGAEAKARVFASTLESVNEQLDAMRIADDPINALRQHFFELNGTVYDLGVIWRSVVGDLSDGHADLASTAGFIDVLAEAMHLTVPEVEALATAQGKGVKAADDYLKASEDTAVSLEDQAKAVAEGIKAWKDHTTAVQEASIAIGDVTEQIPDVAGALNTEFGKVDDLMSGLKFDVDFQPSLNAALDDLHGFSPDLQTLADQWADILKGEPIDIFGNVRADDTEFLDRIGKVRDLFQEGVVNAFGQGGVEAANTFVQSTAAQIAQSTGLDISEVYRIMGLPPDGSITTLIKPEVQKQHADQARSILDSIAGVAPGDARIASIHVALETGQIDGDLAYIASLLLARDMGIPVSLDGIPQADIDAAQAFINNHPVTMPVNANTAPANSTIANFRKNQSSTPIVIPVVARPASSGTHASESVSAGGHAAPLALIPFSGDDEVGINPLAGESVSVASFGSPVSIAGPSFTPVVHNHVTIQAAVIGSRFEVQRAVTAALRAAQRLNGGRAA